MRKNSILSSLWKKIGLPRKKEEDFVSMRKVQDINHSTNSQIEIMLLSEDIFSPEEKKKIALQKYIDEVMDVNIEPNWTFLYDDDVLWELFTEVINAEGYKQIETQEKRMYKSESEALKQYFLPKKVENEVKNIIIYWPGDGEKDVTILKCIDSRLSILENKNIIPVDINTNFVDTAWEMITDIAKEIWVNVTVSWIKDDFRTAKNLNTNKPEWRLYLFFGWSLGNFSQEDIISTISNMKSDKIEWSRHCIMTVFFAPEKTYSPAIAAQLHKAKHRADPNNLDRTAEYNADIQKLISQYSWKEIEQWIMTGFKKLWLDTKNLEFHVTYEENQHDNGWRILVWAKVIKPFRLQNGANIYEKNVWDTIWWIQSKRFDIHTFKEFIEGKTKHKVLDMSHADQWVGIVVLETPKDNPDNLSSEAKKIKSRDMQQSIFYTIAMLASLLLAKGCVEQYVANQENKKIKQKSEEVTNIKTREKEIDPSVYSISNSGDINKELENFKETIVNNIKLRYGVNWSSKDELSFFVRDLIDNNEYVRKRSVIWYEGFRWDNQFSVNEFVDDYIIKKYPRLLTKYWVSQIPYQEMLKYKKTMISTVLSDDKNFWMTQNQFDQYKTIVASFGVWYRWVNIGVVKWLWWNTVPNIVEMYTNDWLKQYILAKNDRDGTDSFNLRLGQEASILILTQQYKCINQISDIMYIYWLNRNSTMIIKKLVEVYSDIPDDLPKTEAHMFIRKYFNTGIYANIKDSIVDCTYRQNEKIQMPYISWDERIDEMKRLWFMMLDKYETKEWIKFWTWTIILWGKKYLVAQNYPIQSVHDYSLANGKIVMDDLMNIKNPSWK